MDSLRNVHHRRSSKDVVITKRRNKKQQQQQVKVVYISNPVHFKTSASEFKGLVQQFTGQDSDVSELSKFACAGADDVASADRTSSSSSTDDDSAAALSRRGAALQQPQPQPQEEPYEWAGAPPLDAFDEIFTPRALENLAAFLPTSLYY